MSNPKSKEYLSSSASDSDDEPKPKKVKQEEAQIAKNEKPEPTTKQNAAAPEKGPNGEAMFQLARMRYATVSEFRGKVLVSIREYYEKDGKLLPGKKGISLTSDQWQSLKGQIDDVDQAIRNL